MFSIWLVRGNMSRSWMVLATVGLAMAAVLPATSAAAVTAKRTAWVQQAELTDGMPSGDGGHFGVWTAVQGATAVVSAPDESGRHGGNVYVFDRGSAGHWLKEAALRGSSGPSTSSFGQALGLAGNTIVVGSWGAGCAFVFQRSAAGAWSQAAVLKPSDGVAANSFGFSVAISASGTILVGDPSRDDWRGAVYAFAKSDGSWRQTAELIPAQAKAGLTFGLSVGLDGSTAAVGAPAVGTGSSSQLPGEGFVYRQGTAGGWTQVAQLRIAGSRAGDLFGRAVAVSGRDVVMSATGRNIENPGDGAAYVFVPTASGYAQGISLLSARPDGFGYSVAALGPEILVGANQQDKARGAVYVFRGNGLGAWPQQQVLTSAKQVVNGRFGQSVAIDDNNLLIGADGVGDGAAYIFRPSTG
jgi:FG-GAP repeat